MHNKQVLTAQPWCDLQLHHVPHSYPTEAVVKKSWCGLPSPDLYFQWSRHFAYRLPAASGGVSPRGQGTSYPSGHHEIGTLGREGGCHQGEKATDRPRRVGCLPVYMST